MDEMNVKGVSPSPFAEMETKRPGTRDALSDFKKALGQSIADLNQQLTQADQSVQEMVLGKRDIHEAMMAIEQANLSLRMMIQVRNKIIAAYEEIMRMQV